MDEQARLAQRFEENRPRLRAVAYRMLGSLSEADDAVQETWLRLRRAGPDGVENLRGWLITAVGRVCLDLLRARTSRREEPLLLGSSDGVAADTDLEQQALLADSVGLALLVVLDTLTPAERLAFVLHDVFDVPFEEIAPIVGRTPGAARQLASRGRRRVRAVTASPDTDVARQRVVVRAFLAASRAGDFEALLAVLDPDAVVRADSYAAPTGTLTHVRGAAAVAAQAQAFARQAERTRLALVDGSVGLVVGPPERPAIVLRFTTRNDRIGTIDVVAHPTRLRCLRLTTLDDEDAEAGTAVTRPSARP